VTKHTGISKNCYYFNAMMNAGKYLDVTMMEKEHIGSIKYQQENDMR
jgi:hypothetical protein